MTEIQAKAEDKVNQDPQIMEDNKELNRNQIDEEKQKKPLWSSIFSKFSVFCKNYCCCCCRRPPPKIHIKKDLPISVEKKANVYKIVKDATQNFEDKFWPNLWSKVIADRVRNESATKIQKVFRGYQGRKYYRQQWQIAMADMNDYWVSMRRNKFLERERRLIEKMVREKVYKNFLYNLMN